MKKPKIIMITFTKRTISTMDDLLSYFTEKGATRLIDKTKFVILYNPYGGYYNLQIRAQSIKDANEFELLIKKYNEQRRYDHEKNLHL